MWTLGIDVSKNELVVRLQNREEFVKEGTFSNDEKGIKKLIKWVLKTIKNLNELRVCMEATNIYWEKVADYFYHEGAQVHVVNPMRIKGFARSQMRRNKTDKVDAQIIADFAQAFPDLTPWHPPTPVQAELKELSRYRESLLKSRTREKNRLKTSKSSAITASIERNIAFLDEQIVQTSQNIKELIDNDPDLKEKRNLLVTIDGIGIKTAEIILAEMYDLESYESARSAAADAGVTPSHYESGTSVRRKPRLSKMGKASVRTALFLPAMTAIRNNPMVREFAKRLKQNGKPPMVILGAAMRKLLHIAYGVIKNRTPFDPNYLSTPSHNLSQS